MSEVAPPPVRVLVVDDEKNIRHSVRVCLEGRGARVFEAADSASALAALEKERPDLCFLDLRLGEESGLDLLPRLLERAPALSVVVVTAYATVETAVEAIRRGAKEYLAKPFTPAQVRHALEQAVRALRLEAKVGELEARLAEAAPDAELESESPAMREAAALALRAAPTEAPVLLRGESGTGKGVLARAVHAASPRAQGPFVVVHCPMLTAELLAAELFGHAKGAFTGAVAERAGKVEAAKGGTLFLDEVSEIAPALQAKLLRFVQDQEYERVGDARPRRGDVRIVAATNRDLAAAVREGSFREDLYFRLNVIEVVVPPLRERREDIPRLAAGFLAFFARAQRRPALALAPDARAAIAAYAWPGNVRELRNALERAAILARGPVIDAALLPEAIRRAGREGARPADVEGATATAATSPSHGISIGGDITLDALEREHVERVVARAETLDEAARILGIDAATLYRKRRKWREESGG